MNDETNTKMVIGVTILIELHDGTGIEMDGENKDIGVMMDVFTITMEI